jgi:prevent-host-death family protein
MAQTYSTYEAKARFSEVIRKVKAGQRIVIEYRGKPVAEIRPIAASRSGVGERLARLEDEGILGVQRRPTGALQSLARRRGALSRFLESRE